MRGGAALFAAWLAGCPAWQQLPSGVLACTLASDPPYYLTPLSRSVRRLRRCSTSEQPAMGLEEPAAAASCTARAPLHHPYAFIIRAHTRRINRGSWVRVVGNLFLITVPAFSAPSAVLSCVQGDIVLTALQFAVRHKTFKPLATALQQTQQSTTS